MGKQHRSTAAPKGLIACSKSAVRYAGMPHGLQTLIMARRTGHAWVTEYGDPANATDFPYLRAVSPLQNVAVPSGSGQYPATMITTGALPY